MQEINRRDQFGQEKFSKLQIRDKQAVNSILQDNFEEFDPRESSIDIS